MSERAVILLKIIDPMEAVWSLVFPVMEKIAIQRNTRIQGNPLYSQWLGKNFCCKFPENRLSLASVTDTLETLIYGYLNKSGGVPDPDGVGLTAITEDIVNIASLIRRR